MNNKPKTMSESFKKLSDDIFVGIDALKNRVDSITRFINNKTKNKFEFEYIGSYANNTTIKLHDLKYDIDVALILKLDDNNLKEFKKELRDILSLYRDGIKDEPKIRWRNYAIAIDFSSDKNSNKEYHFDFTIYNKKSDLFKVVKGKENEELQLENSGNIDLTERINLFDNSKKRAFETTLRLIKHWNKNGKYKNIKIPSICFTDSAFRYFDTSNSWSGTDNYLKIISDIIEIVKNDGTKNFKLSFPPHDNPFSRNTDYQNTEVENKLKNFKESIDKAIETTSLDKKYNILIDYFPGLIKPEDDTDKNDVKYSRSTKNQGA